MNFKSLSNGILAATVATSLFAQDGLERIGKPIPNGIGLQPAASEDAAVTHQLNNILLWLSVFLSLFVCVLLIIVVVKFRDTGKEPKRFSHNTPLEIAWTLIPVVILVILGVFSVPALMRQVSHPEGDVTIRVTGLQWSWDYEYPEEGVSFSSLMIRDKSLLEAYGYQQDEYLLAVDNPIVVPVGKDVIVEVTASDVIHSWKIPALAVQTDGVPGRTLVQHFRAEKEGVYFGQCSELCGKDHAYMPITLLVVSEEKYAQWLDEAKNNSNFFYEPQPQFFNM